MKDRFHINLFWMVYKSEKTDYQFQGVLLKSFSFYRFSMKAHSAFLRIFESTFYVYWTSQNIHHLVFDIHFQTNNCHILQF